MQTPTIHGRLSIVSCSDILHQVMQARSDIPTTIFNSMPQIQTVIARRLEDTDLSIPNAPSQKPYAIPCYTSAFWSEPVIYLAQEQMDLRRQGHYIPPIRLPYYSYLHETGHAFDSTVHRLNARLCSCSDAFQAAYNNDLQAISSSEKQGFIKSLSYYIDTLSGGQQRSKCAAREEVFAEAFSIITGKQPRLNERTTAQAGRHKYFFPRCHNHVKHAIQTIAT